MAIQLTVNNQIFDYPENGEQPGWGEDATAWAEAVTDLLQTLQGDNDIPLTSFTILDGQTNQNVTGLVFNLTQVTQFQIEYFIQRNGTATAVETGIIQGVWDGTNISFSQETTSVDSVATEVGVTFSALTTGQFQYSSSVFPGHTGSTMKFKATTITS